ncbi:hypothetical protein ASPACDRAFT_42419 [Aspergillus aculeatus ATCC 16872]|uniref:Uncharacterized protein n=1 Tax=Aspergillus aculeatus (strain ATCC 16872 / CBS 172.66 / WB 5094) TaxID=690307 RepID=A0A1L9WXM4_ASPA1|nr:uncharacterized protein ASPACDRAFT_42419 [Aspergillus aculeatus ATCC 16872]OJK00919.1 hypothetical protein ASPACDRAFT_42419 [Aspergillus aculeatus ATCC 16872]
MKFSIAVVASVLVATGVAMPIPVRYMPLTPTPNTTVDLQAPSPSEAPSMNGADLMSALQSIGGLDGVLKSIQISSPLTSALGQ